MSPYFVALHTNVRRPLVTNSKLVLDIPWPILLKSHIVLISWPIAHLIIKVAEL